MNKIKKQEKPYEPILVGYARVSTMEQRLDLQLDALKAAGVHDDHIHVEKVSAVKTRPYLDLAIKDLHPGDTLVVWRLDRVARSIKDLLTRVEQIEAAGATLRSLNESFDTKTAGGRFLLHVLGSVAELERQLTVERTQAGMKARADRGGHNGRPPKMTPEKIAKAEKLLQKKPFAEVAEMLEVSMPALYSRFRVVIKGDKRIIKRKK